MRVQCAAGSTTCRGIAPVHVAHMGGGMAAWKEGKQPYIGTNMATGAPQLVEAQG